MKLHEVIDEIEESLNKSEESLRKSEESLIQNVTGRSAQNTDKHL